MRQDQRPIFAPSPEHLTSGKTPIPSPARHIQQTSPGAIGLPVRPAGNARHRHPIAIPAPGLAGKLKIAGIFHPFVGFPSLL
jgi:hypothetical protein